MNPLNLEQNSNPCFKPLKTVKPQVECAQALLNPHITQMFPISLFICGLHLGHGMITFKLKHDLPPQGLRL